MNMEDENYMLYLKQIFKIITIQSNWSEMLFKFILIYRV